MLITKTNQKNKGSNGQAIKLEENNYIYIINKPQIRKKQTNTRFRLDQGGVKPLSKQHTFDTSSFAFFERIIFLNQSPGPIDDTKLLNLSYPNPTEDFTRFTI